ncbi:MAG TPA: guanylate kinase [Verrucomicrobiae bacterium]|nr:guanylate kinase [Verrucomicrobiae bacterium]
MEQQSRTGLIIVVSAPSGGGKSSLCQRLLNWSANLVYSVSCTTRAPRGGEQHGHDYFFLTTGEFEKRTAAGEFLEHALYNGNYYGTPRQFVEEQVGAGRDVLLDIEVQGAAQVVKSVRGGETFAFRNSLVTIFLMPPSLELLERRLRRRGTDSAEVIRKRLALAEQEMEHWREYDYVIVSGKLDDDFEQGKAIVIAEKCRTARVPKGGKPWQQSELSF